jgi:hypothetical protein
MTDDKYPPFTQVGMTSLALIVAGGIYLSAHLPQHVPLGPAIGLLVASVILLVLNLASLLRIEDFAWPRFFQVAKWTLLAYAIIAGMILYAFLQDHVSGGALVILTLSLIVFMLEVPAMIAFTVARYANTQALEPGVHPAG